MNTASMKRMFDAVLKLMIQGAGETDRGALKNCACAFAVADMHSIRSNSTCKPQAVDITSSQGN